MPQTRPHLHRPRRTYVPPSYQPMHLHLARGFGGPRLGWVRVRVRYEQAGPARAGRDRERPCGLRPTILYHHAVFVLQDCIPSFAGQQAYVYCCKQNTFSEYNNMQVIL